MKSPFVCRGRMSFVRWLICFALVSLAALKGQSYKITTLAGSAVTFNPGGVATDAEGNNYVADLSKHSIYKVSPAGVVTLLAGSGSSGRSDGTGSAARFNQPRGIAVDSSGNVFVADSGNNQIRRITPVGMVSTFAGTGSAGSANGPAASASFTGPADVALDSAGNLYVADTANQVVRKITTAGVVTTLAGSVGTKGSLNGTGVAARFSYPEGLAVDGGGTVYVADSGNNMIRKISPAGGVTTLAGSVNWGSADGAGSGARFFGPVGVAVHDGVVFVADRENHRIRRIDSSGVVTTVAGGGLPAHGPSIHSPSYIAADGVGNLIFADYGNARIMTLSHDGILKLMPGSGGPGATDGTGNAASFRNPRGIALGPNGTIYVADKWNNMIRMVSPQGVVTTLAGSGNLGSVDGVGSMAEYNDPVGVAVDGDGNVYVADTGNHTIRKISPEGVVTRVAGGSGVSGNGDAPGSAARFFAPEGLTVDRAGYLYVADRGNNRIRRISPAGEVTTFAKIGSSSGWSTGGTAVSFVGPRAITVNDAGDLYVAEADRIRKISSTGELTTLAGGTFGSQDGTGEEASFNYPEGVAVDGSGNVYVADAGNHLIRKISPAGVVSVLAGSLEVGSADGYGVSARFIDPGGVAADQNGNVYIADSWNNSIRKGVPPMGQSITFGELPDIVFAGQTMDLADLGASTSSGLTVSYIVTGPVTRRNNVLTITSGGTVSITARQGGGRDYYAAESVTRTFQVLKASQTISIEPVSDHTARQSYWPQATASSGLPVSFQIVSGPAILSSNRVSFTGAGTVVIRASQTGNASYDPAPAVERSFQVYTDLLTLFLEDAGVPPDKWGALDDPDGDGVKNIHEFAFNLGPVSANPSMMQAGGFSGLPRVAVVQVDGMPVLEVEFVRRRQGGLVYSVERGVTLDDFIPMEGNPTVTSIDTDWERVTLRDASPSGGGTVFVRVRVTRQ